MKNKYQYRILYLILIILFLFIKMAYGYDYIISVNESTSIFDFYTFQLSSSTNNNTIYFNFTEENNQTKDILFYNFSSIDPNINLNSTTNKTYYNYTTNSLFINNSEIILNIEILLNITNVSNYNHTYYLFLNSSNSNTITNKSFFINISLLPFIIEEPIWHDIDIGEYELYLCNHRLPFSFEKQISIGGNTGQNVSIERSSTWFNEIQNITIGENNYTTISINGIIPSGTTIGKYTEYIYFYFADETIDDIIFYFEIEDCGLILTWDEYIKVCDIYEIGTPEYHYCFMDAQISYNEEWLYNFQELNRTEIVEVEVNVTREIPVEVVKVGNTTFSDVLAAAQSIVDSKGDYDSHINIIENENTQLRTENKEMRNIIGDIPIKINETATKIAEKVLTSQIKKERNKKIRTWLITISILLSGLGYGSYYLYKNNHIY